MITGLDSSYDAPTLAAAAAARDAGVRLWSGYLGTRPGLGLVVLWERSQFDIARSCGGPPLGFCSGWDDPAGVGQLAQAWGVRACLDVETGIRPDGPWVQAWLDASGAGLYGLAGVHAGRRAAFHVVARYPSAGEPGASWDPAAGPRPDAPCGWQWQGSHPEFGRQVDRGTYDDWFGGGDMDPEARGWLEWLFRTLSAASEQDPAGNPISDPTEITYTWAEVKAYLPRILTAVQAQQQPPAVDVTALAAALAAVPGFTDAIATAVAHRMGAALDKA